MDGEKATDMNQVHLGDQAMTKGRPGAMEPRVTPNQPGEERVRQKVVRKGFSEEGSLELGHDRQLGICQVDTEVGGH